MLDALMNINSEERSDYVQIPWLKRPYDDMQN